MDAVALPERGTSNATRSFARTGLAYRDVIGISTVGGVPLIRPEAGAIRRQRISRRRRVAAVAVFTVTVSRSERTPEEEFEGDGAGRVEAAGQLGRVLEDHRRRADVTVVMLGTVLISGLAGSTVTRSSGLPSSLTEPLLASPL